MRKIYLFVLAVIVASLSFEGKAQSVYSSTTNPDPVSGAMGGAGVALRANQFSLYRNMAAIGLSDSKYAVGYGLTLRPSSMIKNYNMHTVAGFYRINNKHSIAAGFRYFTMPKATVPSDINIDLIDNFRPKDFSIDLGYAYAITGYLGWNICIII